ncbi:MAG: anthranilate synthase component I [Nitrososphaeria archaeon]|nr:anthranilate synthase component I [Conexivisphaerales archaeon]
MSVTEKKIFQMPEPYKLFSCIEKENETAALFESVRGPEHLTRYSIIAWGTKERISGKKGKVYGTFSRDFYDPIEVFSELIARSQEIPFPGRYKGGPVGYLSYDAVRYWEDVKDEKPEAEPWPEFEFFIPKNIIVYDNYQENVYIFGEEPKATCGDPDKFRVKLEGESVKKYDFEDSVRKVQEKIVSGYVFQVVISRFYSYTFSGDPLTFYKTLRNVNPSPYMYYLKFGEKKLIGASPETLFSLQDGVIEIYPIAGSRPRGKTTEDDFKLERDLIRSEKERAEHLMLVDLARNDAGKVSYYGSVKVPDLMYVEKYSHVQHMVSRVIGTIRKNVFAPDVLKATFPAGTVSGAPKPYAMNVIEEIEPYKRGPYAGAVGFFSSNGDSEFAISIRSAFVNKDLMRIQAGAGIVYDSVPENEYWETEFKMKALRIAAGDTE